MRVHPTETWLLSQPPTRRQTRWAVAVAVCQVAALAFVAPFAKTQLAEIVMSEIGTSRTYKDVRAMSAIERIPDITRLSV
jgi:hypothetical protein